MMLWESCGKSLELICSFLFGNIRKMLEIKGKYVVSLEKYRGVGDGAT